MRAIALALIALGLLIAGGTVLPSIAQPAAAECGPVGFEEYEHPNAGTLLIPYYTPACLY